MQESNQNTVLGNKTLLFKIVEYLPSREILNLFLLSKLFTIHLNTTYDNLMYKIYRKLYLPLNVKSKLNFDILIMMTIRLIKLDNKLTYVYRKNIKFSEEEVSIRNIIYDIIKSGNITSLYYLLFINGFYQLLNRYIADDIVVSPYECTLSNTIRTRLHYYGNEQTLRLALRFKQHNMVKKILSDMKYITKNKNINILQFIWAHNNILYESVYNDDYEGLSLMVGFVNSIKQRKYFILDKMDCDIEFSNANSYLEDDDEYEMYTESEMNNRNMIHHGEKNLLCYALKKNIDKMFNSWNWGSYLRGLNSNDFIISEFAISENSNFIISENFSEYLKNQRNDIITHFKTHRNANLKQFRLLAATLNTYKQIDIYSYINNIIRHLLPSLILDISFNGNKNIFIILSVLLHYFDNFNIDFVYNVKHLYGDCRRLIYNNNDTEVQNYSNDCNILEFVSNLITELYISCNIFTSNKFVYFVNLLLIHDMLSNNLELVLQVN